MAQAILVLLINNKKIQYSSAGAKKLERNVQDLMDQLRGQVPTLGATPLILTLRNDLNNLVSKRSKTCTCNSRGNWKRRSVPQLCTECSGPGPLSSLLQPIRTCCLSHVTGYQLIRDQYFLIQSVLAELSKSNNLPTGRFQLQQHRLIKLATRVILYTPSLKEVKPRLDILFWRPDLDYVFLTEESEKHKIKIDELALYLLWPFKDGHSANTYLAAVAVDVNQNKIQYTSKSASFQAEQPGFYGIQFYQGVEELKPKNAQMCCTATCCVCLGSGFGLAACFMFSTYWGVGVVQTECPIAYKTCDFILDSKGRMTLLHETTAADRIISTLDPTRVVETDSVVGSSYVKESLVGLYPILRASLKDKSAIPRAIRLLKLVSSVTQALTFPRSRLTCRTYEVKMLNNCGYVIRSCQVLPHYKISSLYHIRGWSNDRGKFHKTQVRAILAWVLHVKRRAMLMWAVYTFSYNARQRFDSHRIFLRSNSSFQNCPHFLSSPTGSRVSKSRPAYLALVGAEPRFKYVWKKRCFSEFISSPMSMKLGIVHIQPTGQYPPWGFFDWSSGSKVTKIISRTGRLISNSSVWTSIHTLNKMPRGQFKSTRYTPATPSVYLFTEYHAVAWYYLPKHPRYNLCQTHGTDRNK
eukprot:sb/3462944/